MNVVYMENEIELENEHERDEKKREGKLAVTKRKGATQGHLRRFQHQIIHHRPIFMS